MIEPLTPKTLAKLWRLAEAATPTPWEWGGSEARPALRRVNRELSGPVLGCGALFGPTKQDADLIVAAVNALPALLDAAARLAEVEAGRDALAAKVEAVRALHFGEYVEGDDRNRCFECGDDWPCPTLRALDEEARL